MRDYRAATNDKANQLTALLEAWLHDVRRENGTTSLHDQLVATLALSRDLLEAIETLPRPEAAHAAP